MSMTAFIYKALLNIIEKTLFPLLVSKQRVFESKGDDFWKTLSANSRVRRLWFHAASVGELESLWATISRWSREPGETIVTVFSESARNHAERIKEEFKGKPNKLLFSGYSPFEGRWFTPLDAVRPHAFITAKYEAWPELWASLGGLGIPLVLVGARARRSLVIARNMCRFMSATLPKMLLVTVRARENAGLERMFPSARVVTSGDPRWDRVAERAKKGNPRAKELIQFFSKMPKPWGVLGSVWPEDISLWRGVARNVKGTLWVVPHKISQEFSQKIRSSFDALGYEVIQSSTMNGSQAPEQAAKPCLLIDEMGFLSELYSSADWAYVGGGFTNGVHSTIEPGIHGLPIAIGPKSAAKFSEIEELGESKELRIVRSSAELTDWLATLDNVQERREEWRRDAAARLGAGDRVFAEIIRQIQA